MFNLIFSALFIFIALIFMLCGMLKGRKYRWQFSLSRIIIVVISAIIATLLSALVSWLLGGLVFGLLEGFLTGAGEVGTLISSLPTAPDTVRAVIAMIIAPVIFVTFFIIIRSILNIFSGKICKLIMKIGGKTVESEPVEDAEETPVQEIDEGAEETPVAVAEENSETEAVEGVETEQIETAVEDDAQEEKKEKKKKKKRYSELRSDKKFDGIGALCGAACGLLLFVAFLSPLVGLLNTVDDTVSVIAGSSEDEVMVMVTDITGAAADNVGSKTVQYLGGNLIYRGLTTYKINGRVASLSNETKFLGTVGKAVVSVSDSETDDKTAADNIREVGEHFEDSTVIPMLLSDLLSAASDDWSRGEAFCGISRPSLGEDFDIIVEDFVVIMKDSNYDTIGSDVRTIANTIAVVIENRSAESTSQQGGALGMFGNEKLVSGVMLELLNNERLSTLVESFTNVGISVFAKNLSLPESNDALYNGFVTDMSSAYTQAMAIESASERMSALSKSIADTYDKYGIELTSGVSYCIAANMLEGVSSSDEAAIKGFFAAGSGSSNVMAAGGVAVVPLSSSQNGGKALSLTEKIKNRTSSATTKEELSAIVKEELQGMSAVGAKMSDEELTALSEKIAGDMHKDIKADAFKYKKAVFNDSKDLGSLSACVTRDELNVTLGTITDKEKESKALAAVFSSAIEVVDSISGGDFEVEGTVVSFGPVLDSFAASEIIGEDHTAKLLSAIFQSDKVRSNIGFSLIQASNLADKINSGIKEDETYTMMLKSIGDTISIIKLSAESKDTTEAVTELMKDLTPTSAEALQMLSTPETVKNYGVSDTSAEPVSDMLSDMFGNMSTAKENGMSDEQYERESVAVNDMMNIAMSATKSNEQSAFGENSATGITATEFVDRTTSSVIVSDTFVNTVYKDGAETPVSDPLASNKKLSAEDESELVGALDAKWKQQLATSNDEQANTEYQKVLTSIAAVVNVNVGFSGDSVTVVNG